MSAILFKGHSDPRAALMCRKQLLREDRLRLGDLLPSKATANYTRCQQRFEAQHRAHDHASSISRGDSVLMLVPIPARGLQVLGLRLQGPYTVLTVSTT